MRLNIEQCILIGQAAIITIGSIHFMEDVRSHSLKSRAQNSLPERVLKLCAQI